MHDRKDGEDMKLFFISDIHGSYYYTRKALEAFRREEAEYIAILGDVLYHGARNPLPLEYNPQETAKVLNELAGRIIAIRGNCDSEVDQMVLDFPIMADYASILYNGRRLFLTHGHLYNDSHLPKLKENDILFYGHTHVPELEKKDGLYMINPGSITFSKENTPNSYGVLEDHTFFIKDLDGNLYKRMDLV